MDKPDISESLQLEHIATGELLEVATKASVTSQSLSRGWSMPRNREMPEESGRSSLRREAHSRLRKAGFELPDASHSLKPFHCAVSFSHIVPYHIGSSIRLTEALCINRNSEKQFLRSIQ